MSGTLAIDIQLFGACRLFADDHSIRLEVPQDTRIADLRQILCTTLAARQPGFDQHKLVQISALADERSILRDDHVLKHNTSLAILPPVCGG